MSWANDWADRKNSSSRARPVHVQVAQPKRELRALIPELGARAVELGPYHRELAGQVLLPLVELADVLARGAELLLGRAQLAQHLALFGLELLRAAALLGRLALDVLELLLLLVLVHRLLRERKRGAERGNRGCPENEHEHAQRAHRRAHDQCFRVSGTSTTSAPTRPRSLANPTERERTRSTAAAGCDGTAAVQPRPRAVQHAERDRGRERGQQHALDHERRADEPVAGADERHDAQRFAARHERQADRVRDDEHDAERDHDPQSRGR
jgi:hypothetical protein